MVEDYAKKPQTKGTVAQKIASIYNLYMDSVRRNREGYTPIKPVLAKIRAAKNRKDLIKLSMTSTMERLWHLPCWLWYDSRCNEL